MKEPKYNWGKVSHGDIGVVDKFEDGHVYIDFPSQARWHGLAAEVEVEPVADAVREGCQVLDFYSEFI